jgi:hypothetical protein
MVWLFDTHVSHELTCRGEWLMDICGDILSKLDTEGGIISKNDWTSMSAMVSFLAHTARHRLVDVRTKLSARFCNWYIALFVYPA